MPQLRQPRLAELVAGRLREEILSGRLAEGDVLGNQEQLFNEYQVSPPAMREAMRILETDGLITVRRGNVGGAVVHVPTAQRVAQMIAMVLQSRRTPPTEVSKALEYLEPVCAELCAARPDRAEAVVPILREHVENQRENIQDVDAYLRFSHEFHGSMISLCGNEAMIVVIGALQAIWSSHASLVWENIAHPSNSNGNESSALTVRRSSLRAHERLVDVIEKGDAKKAGQVAAAHLAAATPGTLRESDREAVVASRLSNFAG